MSYEFQSTLSNFKKKKLIDDTALTAEALAIRLAEDRTNCGRCP